MGLKSIAFLASLTFTLAVCPTSEAKAPQPLSLESRLIRKIDRFEDRIEQNEDLLKRTMGRRRTERAIKDFEKDLRSIRDLVAELAKRPMTPGTFEAWTRVRILRERLESQYDAGYFRMLLKVYQPLPFEEDFVEYVVKRRRAHYGSDGRQKSGSYEDSYFLTLVLMRERVSQSAQLANEHNVGSINAALTADPPISPRRLDRVFSRLIPFHATEGSPPYAEGALLLSSITQLHRALSGSKETQTFDAALDRITEESPLGQIPFEEAKKLLDWLSELYRVTAEIKRFESGRIADTKELRDSIRSLVQALQDKPLRELILRIHPGLMELFHTLAIDHLIRPSSEAQSSGKTPTPLFTTNRELNEISSQIEVQIERSEKLFDKVEAQNLRNRIESLSSHAGNLLRRTAYDERYTLEESVRERERLHREAVDLYFDIQSGRSSRFSEATHLELAMDYNRKVYLRFESIRKLIDSQDRSIFQNEQTRILFPIDLIHPSTSEYIFEAKAPRTDNNLNQTMDQNWKKWIDYEWKNHLKEGNFDPEISRLCLLALSPLRGKIEDSSINRLPFARMEAALGAHTDVEVWISDTLEKVPESPEILKETLWHRLRGSISGFFSPSGDREILKEKNAVAQSLDQLILRAFNLLESEERGIDFREERLEVAREAYLLSHRITDLRRRATSIDFQDLYDRFDGILVGASRELNSIPVETEDPVRFHSIKRRALLGEHTPGGNPHDELRIINRAIRNLGVRLTQAGSFEGEAKRAVFAEIWLVSNWIKKNRKLDRVADTHRNRFIDLLLEVLETNRPSELEDLREIARVAANCFGPKESPKVRFRFARTLAVQSIEALTGQSESFKLDLNLRRGRPAVDLGIYVGFVESLVDFKKSHEGGSDFGRTSSELARALDALKESRNTEAEEYRDAILRHARTESEGLNSIRQVMRYSGFPVSWIGRPELISELHSEFEKINQLARRVHLHGPLIESMRVRARNRKIVELTGSIAELSNQLEASARENPHLDREVLHRHFNEAVVLEGLRLGHLLYEDPSKAVESLLGVPRKGDTERREKISAELLREIILVTGERYGFTDLKELIQLVGESKGRATVAVKLMVTGYGFWHLNDFVEEPEAEFGKKMRRQWTRSMTEVVSMIDPNLDNEKLQAKLLTRWLEESRPNEERLYEIRKTLTTRTRRAGAERGRAQTGADWRKLIPTFLSDPYAKSLVRSVRSEEDIEKWSKIFPIPTERAERASAEGELGLRFTDESGERVVKRLQPKRNRSILVRAGLKKPKLKEFKYRYTETLGQRSIIDQMDCSLLLRSLVLK